MMRIASKIVHAASLLAIVALIAVGVLVAHALMPSASADQPPGDIIELHSDLTQVTTAQCVACHGDKSQEQSLDPNIETPHAIHVPMLGECNYCHKSADLLEGSAANLRKQVSAEVCAGCHGPGGSAPQIYGVEPQLAGVPTPEATPTPEALPPTGAGSSSGDIPWTAYVAAAGGVLFLAGALAISYKARRRPS